MKALILLAVTAVALAACEERVEAPANGWYGQPDNQTQFEIENPRYPDGTYK